MEARSTSHQRHGSLEASESSQSAWEMDERQGHNEPRTQHSERQPVDHLFGASGSNGNLNTDSAPSGGIAETLKGQTWKANSNSRWRG